MPKATRYFSTVLPKKDWLNILFIILINLN
jgi:hypothetical protein